MNKIEGVPEGWEAVAFRRGRRGEWIMASYGHRYQLDCDETIGHSLIIRRIEPVCTWQHGVFADGHVSQDQDGSLYWWGDHPRCSDSEWIGLSKFVCPLAPTAVVFRSDLPWTERIQRVGPTIEATLKGAT